MEPWDGPACITFTDGSLIGAVLDRNGLRPSRYWVTEDGLVVLASEVGVLDLDPATVVRKGRLQPGRMFLVDTDRGRIVDDAEIKAELAAEAPYDEWLHAGQIHLADLPEREHVVHTHASVTRRQQTFGYTEEELRVLLTPMARNGAEPIGSMGTDTPIAVLSGRPRLLFDYFSQLFAQVTNPPLDAIREELVTSLGTAIGPDQNLLTATPAHCRQVVLDFPVIDNDQLAKILHINRDGDLPGFAAVKIRGLYPVAGGGPALQSVLEDIFAEVSEAVAAGARFIVLSDRDSDAEWAPIPSLLLTSAVHHHLIREKTRTQVGLVVEAGDVREVHHVALLIGYGASRGQPLPRDGVGRGPRRQRRSCPVAPEKAVREPHQGARQGRAQGDVEDGHLDGGVATTARRCSRRSASTSGSSTATSPARRPSSAASGSTSSPRRWRRRHAIAYPRGGATAPAHRTLDVGGEYQWRREGELHLFNPETVFRLQHATRARRYDVFKQYTTAVDAQSERLMTLRGPVPVQGRRRERAGTGADRRGRAGRGDRQALLHRRDVLRLDLAGGARDARDRHEPARRQVQHRRGRRGQRAAVRRPRARPSSRWPAAASASPASTSSTPTTCRSRWRRARSRARAASCPATRSTRGSRGPGTRRRASA